MRLPEFLDNRHMKVAKLSALCTGRFYPPSKYPSYLSRYWLSRTQIRSAAEDMKSMKNPNDPSGNQTQPTVLPHTAA